MPCKCKETDLPATRWSLACVIIIALSNIMLKKLIKKICKNSPRFFFWIFKLQPKRQQLVPSVFISGNPKKVHPKCSTLYSKTFFRLTPNQLALYPNWILLYLLKIILPMLAMVAIASKILIKNGKELRREFFQAILANLQTRTFPKQDKSSLDY